MGGLGSGRWRWHSKADTVEDCHALDLRWLARQAAFQPWYSATVTWSRGERQLAAIGYVIRPNGGTGLTLVLKYEFTPRGAEAPENIEVPIALETTQPHLGGSRWWGRCPLVIDKRPCCRRIAKLYLPPGARYFGCRRCHGLSYKSAQQHDKRVDWLRRHPEVLNTLVRRGPGQISDTALFLALKAIEYDDVEL